jgi:kynureninase
MIFENKQSFALEADQADQLKDFRQLFCIPQQRGRDTIYLTGNSLGLQPRQTREYILQELDDWANLGVEGHFHAQNPWMPYHEILTHQLATMCGALPQEVVAMNQLTVNLHLLLVSFYRPTTKRFKIICEAKAFPSDQYAIESQVRYHGYEPNNAIVEVHPRPGEYCLHTEDILAAIDENKDSLSLLLFGGVNYYTGQFFDIPKLTAAAHAVGALAGFDLAHAAGNVPLHLHDWQVDFACWCSYKYLNSGPGGVSGVFIHKKHVQNTSLHRFAGWWGYEKSTRFKMEKGFKAIETAEGWQLSNAPVLSMAAHKAALDVFEAAGWENLFQKANLLSGYLHFLLNDLNRTDAFTVITPLNAAQRGCQVSLLMKRNGRKIFDHLTQAGIVADWREPDVIRVAPVPIYNSFQDVWTFYQILNEAISDYTSCKS